MQGIGLWRQGNFSGSTDSKVPRKVNGCWQTTSARTRQEFWCYGFPMGHIAMLASHLLLQQLAALVCLSTQACVSRSIRSSIRLRMHVCPPTLLEHTNVRDDGPFWHSHSYHACCPCPHQASAKIGPAARKLLAERGLTASDVTPTGPQNIVTKGDVLAAVSAGVKPT